VNQNRIGLASATFYLQTDESNFHLHSFRLPLLEFPRRDHSSDSTFA
jgi:hypothetical protein